MRGPTFLLIGAARSGTTAVAGALNKHPGVFVTDPKEPHYFAFHGRRPAFTGPDDDFWVNSVAVVDWDEYLALYPGGESFTACGDASATTLYYYERAIPEIARRIPDPRLVVLLREPVARAYSAFEFMRSLGLEPCESFAEALRLESGRIAEGWQPLFHYAAESHYAEPVAAFVDHFGSDRVRVWFHDDLERDYAQTLAEILSFVSGESVSPASVPPRQIVNAGGRPRSQLVIRAIAAGRKIEPVHHVMRSLTPYSTRQRIRRALLTKTDVPDEARERLTAHFAPDLAALRDVLDLDRMPSWMQSAGI